MVKQVEIEKVPTYQLVSKHSAFKGTSWQEAYFKVMSYQNTFDFAYQTTIGSNFDHEAFLCILLRGDADRFKVIEWLTDLGYGDIDMYKVMVGEVNTYNLDVDFIVEA